MRADLAFREWEDFYSSRTQLGDTAAGTDVLEIGNFGDNVLERTYTGLLVSARYRFTDRFTLAGNYTWSEAEGNTVGEFANSGPVTIDPNTYPEYADPAWSYPVGRLPTDQEHKLRVWGVYDIFDNERHNLNVSVLQNFFSGTPYSGGGAVDTRPFVNNPGYLVPPTNVPYFMACGNRDCFTTDDVTRTDLALNYTFRWNLWGKSFEVFFQPEIVNLFDEDAVVNPNTDLHDETSGASNCPGGCQGFNPFTTTPVEGVNYVFGDEFGQADEADDFQQPRTFRFSLGFRF